MLSLTRFSFFKKGYQHEHSGDQRDGKEISSCFFQWCMLPSATFFFNLLFFVAYHVTTSHHTTPHHTTLYHTEISQYEDGREGILLDPGDEVKAVR